MADLNLLTGLRHNLQQRKMLLAEEPFLDRPTVIGYVKKFRWVWLGTQLNTFVVASDYGNELITAEVIREHLNEAFRYANKNNRGLPRFFFGAIAAISVIISENLSAEAKEICHHLKFGKRVGGISIPVTIDKLTGEIHSFDYDPLWGAIFMPYLRRLIVETTERKG